MLDQFFQIVLTVLVPGIFSAYLNRKINTKGPKLVYYVQAATWFTNITPPQNRTQESVQQQNIVPFNLGVITIAIKNNGNQVAKNIDISHFQWPHLFQVVPYVTYEILPQDGPGPKKIIRLKSLNQGETIWISYLFPSILNLENFIEYVRSEEVTGTRTNMILNRVFPPHVSKLFGFLLILGIIFTGFIIWWLYPPLAFFLKALISFPR